MVKRPFYFSLSLVISTLFLIFVGGLVTSTSSGLAVPDWPLSYGRLMPPMVGGVFYEHGHRMVATAIGLLTILLVWIYHRDVQILWLRRLSWVALGLVIVQGGLGGLTVLLRLPAVVSILHACTAQTFFSLVVALTVWTSKTWSTEPLRRIEPNNSIPCHHLGCALFIVSFTQLILGALVRHTGGGFRFHIVGGFLVLVLSIWISVRVIKNHHEHLSLKRWAFLHTFSVGCQIVLGFVSYFLKIHDFDVIPIPFYAIATITTHVMVGAFVLGCSVVLGLLIFHTRPVNSVPIQKKLSDYYQLTKPGISLMAAMTALAGFLMGSTSQVDFQKLVHTILGTLLVAAAAGILNMLLERDIDMKMHRTRRRPLPAGRMNAGEAMFLGSLLAVIGIVYLSWAVNTLTALLAGLTLTIYLYVYTPLKKISVVCITIGAIAGALPPLMGWSAATGTINFPGLVLFGILFFWQFPHFFSLAWLYKDDYALAGLHMLPRLNDDGRITAWSMILNSVAMLMVSLILPLFGFAGYLYLITVTVLGVTMIITAIGFLRHRGKAQAKAIFFASIAYVPLLVGALVLTHLISTS